MSVHPDVSGTSAAPLQVMLNGEAVQLPYAATLAQLLDSRQLDPLTHATAVNGQFVARGQRETCLLQQGDTIMCFQAIVGG